MKLTFGEKIKNLREDQDLTQGQLGKLVNMTQRKISYIENILCYLKLNVYKTYNAHSITQFRLRAHHFILFHYIPL